MTSSVVKRAYKYRFYPTPEQESLLRRTFGCIRVVYNKSLEQRTTAWKTQKQSLVYRDTSALLTQWKKTEEYTWLNEVSSVPLQQSLRHLQSAFTRFWSTKNGYPRFKNRKSRQSAEFTASAFRWDGTNLTLAKMSQPLDIHWSRPLPQDTVPSTVTVSHDPAGRWFVSLLVEEDMTHLPVSENSVGVDLGIDHFAVFSSGQKVANPRFSRKDQARMSRAQRDLSRKQKGSKNREKARRKVARVHARIADCRRDFLHQLSTRIVRENQTIVLEDLSVKGMSAKGGSRKRGLNRSITDAGWAQLRSLLEYKTYWYGRNLIVIDRWFPSSQLCSTCGRNDGKKPLSVREWTCPRCGSHHDRDVNAAKNILAAGLAVSVCGDGGSLGHAIAV